MTDDRWLVVGLGNPGPGYAAHRHNVGAMVVAELATRHGARFTSHRAQAAVAEARLGPGGARLALARPGTFMNNSGRPVAALLAFYSLEPDRLIVVHDELEVVRNTLSKVASDLTNKRAQVPTQRDSLV